jgi:uncharacterized membrane protein
LTHRLALALCAALTTACEGDARDPSDGALGSSAAAAMAGGANTGVGWCSVKKILDRACIACHTNPPVNNAPLPLTSYAELAMVSPLSPDQKVYESVAATVTASRAVLGRYSPMPPGVPLPAGEVELIVRWAAQGAPLGSSQVCPP